MKQCSQNIGKNFKYNAKFFDGKSVSKSLFKRPLKDISLDIGERDRIL